MRTGKPGDVRALIAVRGALTWEFLDPLECQDEPLIRRAAGILTGRLSRLTKRDDPKRMYKCKACGFGFLGFKARDKHRSRCPRRYEMGLEVRKKRLPGPLKTRAEYARLAALDEASQAHPDTPDVTPDAGARPSAQL